MIWSILCKRFQKNGDPAANFVFFPLGQGERVRDMRLVFFRINYIIDNLVKQPVKHLRRRIQQHRAGITGAVNQNPDITDFL